MKSKNRLEKLDLDLIQELNAKDSEMISGGAIEFLPVDRIYFDSSKGATQVESETVTFGGQVLKAEALLNGFDIKYDNKDHNVLRQKINLYLDKDPNNSNTVRVTAEFLLRDSSGNIDDPFSGWVDAVVIADVA